MLIFSEKQKKTFFLGRYKLSKPSFYSLCFVGLVAALLLVFSSTPGLSKIKKEFFVNAQLEWVNSKIEIRKGLLGWDIPEVNLHIKQDEFMALKVLRDMSLKDGAIRKKFKKKWFPAKLIDRKGHVQKAKVRLKGDLTDHLDHEYKWSLRVKMKKKNAWKGMRIFSIHHPKTKMYLANVFVSQLYEKIAGLSPRTFFVNVKINGKKIGIMNLEEAPSKELLEYQQRREGVIVRFNEAFLMEEWIVSKRLLEKEKIKNQKDYYAIFNKIQNTRIDPVGRKKVLSTPALKKQYLNAVSLLRGYIFGEIDPFDVFDRKALINFFAYTQITPISDYYHSLEWKNVRFYYNPVIHKLEPFFMDTNTRLSVVQDNPFFNSVYMDKKDFEIDPWHYTALAWSRPIFKDKSFVKDFKKRVFEIINELSESKKFKPVYRNMKAYNKLISLEYSGLFEPFDKSQWIKYLNFVAEEFKNEKIIIDQDVEIPFTKVSTSMEKVKSKTFQSMKNIIHIFNLESQGQSTLELINPINKSVKVLKIVLVNSKGKEIREIAKEKMPYPIRGHTNDWSMKMAKSHLFKYKKPAEKDFEIRVTLILEGSEENREQKATMAYAEKARGPILPKQKIQNVLKKHSYLVLTDKVLSFKVGSWRVKEDILVPQGYSLNILPATEILFLNQSGIISQGEVRIKGSEEAPVILTGTREHPWSGIFVFDAPKTSAFENVELRWLQGFNRPVWGLSGSVVFYRSDVDFKKVSIKDNFSEDALNIINSKFQLDSLVIDRTVSDGFDSDYSIGAISNSIFKDIGSAGGGDGVDFSGSEVSILNCKFSSVKDKAVSVGEGSAVEASGVQIRDSSVGFASKDGSRLKVDGGELLNISLSGVMAYNKKPEYGPASVYIKNVEFSSVAEEFQIQKNNIAYRNGEKVASGNLDVIKLYKEQMKKGFRNAN